jgi:hypothetical protein
LNIVERSITAERLIAELEKCFAAAGGPPRVLRMDNGPELISQVLRGAQEFAAASGGGLDIWLEVPSLQLIGDYLASLPIIGAAALF